MNKSYIRRYLIKVCKVFGLYTILRLIKNVFARNLDCHGQTGEDKIISGFFLNEDFTYIDIGSGEPILRSNSYLFYKAGKSGILVDPLFSNKILSMLIRPRDTFLQCLVGEFSGVRTFWEFQDYEYSTMKWEVVSELVQSGRAKVKNSKNIKVVTLSKIVEQLKSPEIPWFLSVDVEGADFEVIKSYDFLQNRPRLICIEDHAYAQSGSSKQHEHLTSLNYRLVSQTKLSMIYLDAIRKP